MTDVHLYYTIARCSDDGRRIIFLGEPLIPISVIKYYSYYNYSTMI